MMFCGNCDEYQKTNSAGLCYRCSKSARNGEKIVGGAVVGGLLGGPVGIAVGGILGGLLGERDDEDFT